MNDRKRIMREWWPIYVPVSSVVAALTSHEDGFGNAERLLDELRDNDPNSYAILTEHFVMPDRGKAWRSSRSCYCR